MHLRGIGINMIVTKISKLREKSRETTSSEVKEACLIERLSRANKTAWTEGAGLAAIQIGVPLRFAWYKFPGFEGTLLNPVIIKKFGSIISEEGCLSIPNKFIKVKRALDIEYLTNGKKKKAHGFLACLIQHEIDHMDGILIIDKKISKGEGV